MGGNYESEVVNAAFQLFSISTSIFGTWYSPIAVFWASAFITSVFGLKFISWWIFLSVVDAFLWTNSQCTNGNPIRSTGATIAVYFKWLSFFVYLAIGPFTNGRFSTPDWSILTARAYLSILVIKCVRRKIRFALVGATYKICKLFLHQR